MRRRRTRKDLAPIPFESLLRDDRTRSCDGKDAYPSDAHARAVAAMNGLSGALFTYRCRYCEQWHLTRRREQRCDT